MEYLWVAALLILGVLMVWKPALLWKIEHIFTTKNGEPTELYLGLMRLGGAFFLICGICVVLYCLLR